jgi:hypothetical protein
MLFRVPVHGAVSNAISLAWLCCVFVFPFPLNTLLRFGALNICKNHHAWNTISTGVQAVVVVYFVYTKLSQTSSDMQYTTVIYLSVYICDDLLPDMNLEPRHGFRDPFRLPLPWIIRLPPRRDYTSDIADETDSEYLILATSLIGTARK